MDQTRPPDPRARAAPSQERPRTAPPPAAAPAAIPARPAPAAAAPPATAPEHLTIVPQLAGANAATLEIDWEAVIMGNNRSLACVVSAVDGGSVTATLVQGLYRRSATGEGTVKAGPVPPAAAGSEGSLTARHEGSGDTARFVWRWQPREAAAPAPAPSRKAGILSRLFTTSRPTASSSRQATVAQRLGPRAAQAVALTFFGQEAVGQRFAFLLDRSGSMGGARWRASVQQLERALRAMPAQVEFKLILFASGLLEPPGRSGWQRAEPHTVAAVLAWVESLRPGGGTDARAAFQHVFASEPAPDVVYFLTDGEIHPFSPAACAELRGANVTVINAVALENGASAEALTEMAAATGGQFVLVPSAEEGVRA